MSKLSKQDEFMELLESHLTDLNAYSLAITKNPEDARDLISEGILKAYENFEKLLDKSKFRSWIFTIVTNNHRRNAKRRKLFADYDEEAAIRLESPTNSPETLTDLNLLYEAMAKLGKKQRQAIALFEISGFSIEEIAEIQKVSISGVKSRLRRGREKLRKILSNPKEFPHENGSSNGLSHEKSNGNQKNSHSTKVLKREVSSES